jgi:hypothetical protein
LLNYSRYRDLFEQQALGDVSAITGQVFSDLAEADEVAKQVIADSDSTHDDVWVRVMHRRTLRLSMIIAGTDPDAGNPLFHRLDPILDQ